MKAPPPHPNELERLSDLAAYDILDTGAEKVFDELAELAATICGTRYAAITLIDRDRQWFKAAYGLSISETTRDESVCGHAILEEGVFEVPNAGQDERFVDNPVLNQGPRLRYYAGSQLLSDRGNPIGMLCVLDSEPGQLSDSQRTALSQLADVVMAVLEAGRQARRLNWFGTWVELGDEDICVIDAETLMLLHGNARTLHHCALTLPALRETSAENLLSGVTREQLLAQVERLRGGERHVVFAASYRQGTGPLRPLVVQWQLLEAGGRQAVVSTAHEVDRGPGGADAGTGTK